MQSLPRKIFVFLLIIFTLTPKTSKSQDITTEKKSADSLFNDRQYTQALELYESSISKNGMLSPQDLLKTAKIREGLGDFDYALYYLTKYYKISEDEFTSEKISSIADKHNLYGYETDDVSYAKNWLKKYKKPILISLTTLLTVLFIIFALQKVIKKQNNVAIIISNFMLALIILSMLFITSDKQMGIVTGKKVLVMATPSPGANLIEQIGAGHKVNVISQKDIWSQIDWNGQLAFIRTKNLIVFEE